MRATRCKALTFVDLVLLLRGASKEFFDVPKDCFLKFKRDLMADDLEEAVVKAATADFVHELPLGSLVVAIER